MSSYKRLDSDVSGSGGGSRFRLGLSPSKPVQQRKEREDSDSKEEALANSFCAEFPNNSTSTNKDGFVRLDSQDDEETEEDVSASETKKKKHYLKFLTRARKRNASVSAAVYCRPVKTHDPSRVSFNINSNSVVSQFLHAYNFSPPSQGFSLPTVNHPLKVRRRRRRRRRQAEMVSISR